MEQIKKAFINEHQLKKAAYMTITPGMTVLELKSAIIVKMFKPKCRKLISDLQITRNQTNFFDSKYHNNDAFIIFSNIEDKFFYIEDIRYNIYIKAFKQNTIIDLFFPLAFQNNFQHLIDFLTQETKVNPKYIHLFQNNQSQKEVIFPEDIKNIREDGLIALLFPINVKFLFKKNDYEINFKKNQSVLKIHTQVKNKFEINSNDFIFQTSNEIINIKSHIHNILSNYEEDPVLINVILKNEIEGINIHVPFHDSFYKILFPMKLDETFNSIIPKIKSYFNTNKSIRLLDGISRKSINLNHSFFQYLNGPTSFIEVDCDFPLKISRSLKIKVQPIDIFPNDKIEDFYEKIQSKEDIDPIYNYSFSVDHKGHIKKLKRRKKFTDYFISSDDVIYLNITNENECLHKIKKLKSKLHHKSQLIEEKEREINKLKEENLELQKLKSLKKTRKNMIIYDKNEFNEDQSTIGYGGFSIVYNVSKNQHFAKKELTETGMMNDGIRRYISEAEILFTLRHPCIIRIHGFYPGDRENPPYIVLSLEPASLKSAIENNDLSPIEKCRIVVEIVLGMRYIHSNKFIHRDLKPSNILLSKNKHVRISDFGLACLDDPELTKTNSSGSLPFMAPELLRLNDDEEEEEVKYDNKIDVYAFGIVIFFIILGQLPPLNLERVVSGIPPKIPANVHNWVRNMILKCIQLEPAKRPSFNDIFEELKMHHFNIFSDDGNEKINISSIEERILKIEAFEYSIQ